MPENNVAYPLIFTFGESVGAPRFMAGVSGSGRALMVQEGDGSWWLYGVEPGGIAGRGDSPQEAHLKFVEALKGVLLDIAADMSSFQAFEQQVQKFFKENDRKEEARWREALEAIRSGALRPEAPFSGLPRQSAESDRYVVVQEIEPKALPPVESRNAFALPTAA
jgi:predicted RNase H-like HicB family nuclease